MVALNGKMNEAHIQALLRLGKGAAKDGERLLASQVRETTDEAQRHVNGMTPRELGSGSMGDTRLARGLRSRPRASSTPTVSRLQVQGQLLLRDGHLNGA
jgi:hypothetical protein